MQSYVRTRIPGKVVTESPGGPFFQFNAKLIHYNFSGIEASSYFYNISEENVDIPNSLFIPLFICPLIFLHQSKSGSTVVTI